MQLANHKDCTGCTACVNSCPNKCINMEMNEEGFLYPFIDESKCTNCNLCEKVCPILKKINKKDIKDTIAYAAYANKEEIRMKSSSGGIFYLLAKKVIEQSGIVVGCAFDTNNLTEHVIIENEVELEQILRSKYLQSNLKDIFVKIRLALNNNRLVLFCGTPCQIAGLKSFLLNQEYTNLYCVDFVCHGVVSPGFWNIYLQMIEEKIGGKAYNINFRNKYKSWRNCELTVDKENGKGYSCSQLKDEYMQLFLKNITLRQSCYRCKYKGIDRQADLTLSDFWSIKKVYPDMDDDKGVSLIFFHREKGRKLFLDIETQITKRKIENIYDSITKYGPALRSVKLNRKRKKFFKFYKKREYEKGIKVVLKDSVIEKGIKKIEYYEKIIISIFSGVVKK